MTRTPLDGPTNRLVHETSPYLLQHAHNPVDWHPWGPDALALAREKNRPILLSVGYSACHWCHVMERESFEDPTTAAQMNAHFVNIKVDREERPDLDEIYMKAVQAFTDGHGGWPMTVFLTPDGRPFYAGTYYPPQPAHGLPSFRQLLSQLAHAWTESQDEITRVTTDVDEWLSRGTQLPAPVDGPLSTDWCARVADAAGSAFDPRFGGFGGAPKFPSHGVLAAMLVDWHQRRDPNVKRQLIGTLEGMARGGMWDHLDGGFARYSVDASWRIPHFEKMLYDNAQLVPIYIDAARAFDRPDFARIARETCVFVDRVLTLDRGGVCAALDADSEGEEGRFYVWTPETLIAVLGADEGARAADLLEVTPAGNFENGHSVLRLEQPLEQLEPADAAFLRDVFPRLRAARSQREWPGRDDKVITSQNALMVRAWAVAGSALAEPAFVKAACRAARFIESDLVVGDRLRRTWKDGRAPLLAYADDHAALSLALVELYQATGDLYWLERSVHWAEVLLELFWDPRDGGLFYTGTDAEPLIVRSKNPISGSEPSAHGLAALALARLAVFTGRTDLGSRADAILARYQPLLDKHPRGLGLEAVASAWRTSPSLELALFGASDSEPVRAMMAELRHRHLPLLAIAQVAPDDQRIAAERIPWLANRGARPDQAKAYLCEGHACQLPATTPAALASQLDSLG